MEIVVDEGVSSSARGPTYDRKDYGETRRNAGKILQEMSRGYRPVIPQLMLRLNI